VRFILILILLCLFALAFWKHKPGPHVLYPHQTPMLAWRKTAVSLFLFAFLAGSALVTLRSGQAWPIVRYRIYDIARVRVRQTYLRLVGTRRDGSDFPFLDNKYMTPLDPSLLAGTVQNTLGSANGQSKLNAMVADIYSRYERRRQQQRHDGPPLVRLRLVREVYAYVDPQASNFGHPDQKQVLSEYTSAGDVTLKGNTQ
jgi:hypothetical protein